MNPNLFQDLFIFEIANNHQGDVQHGLNLIRALGEVARREKIRAAVKFQFRHLDTFLSDHHRRQPDAMATRFLSTALSQAEFAILLGEVKAQKMLSICTPFDEPSADQVKEMGFDFVKVASCSATDIPLLRKIAGLGLPTVASTAGLTFSQVDSLVGILGSNQTPLAIMHCVALYPTENHELRLDRISELRSRFPQLTVGFSTHERPDNFLAVQLAYAQGARLFEKHVGLPSDQIKLNAYSANPEQLTAWIQAWKSANAACRSDSPRPELDRETESLRSLKRACVAARPIKKGEAIQKEDVTLSLLFSPTQLLVEEFREGDIAHRDYAAGEPVERIDPIASHIDQLKSILARAGLAVSQGSKVEISHHHGIQNFLKTGAFILTRADEPLRKLLVFLPKQEHPVHFHEDRNETIRVLHGSLVVELDGRRILLAEGDEILIPKESWHHFSTADGAVIEELADDPGVQSFYRDETIQRLPRQERKTFVPLV